MVEFDWLTDGAVVVRGLIPEHDVDKYLSFFHETYTATGRVPRDDDYIRFAEVRDLLCHRSIADMFSTIGLDGHVENCLLDWKYEPTGWHSDRLPHLTRTSGVIIALDELDPRSGLYEMIPGSHRWNLDLNLCAPLAKAETSEYLKSKIAGHLESVYRFEGSKGDVLIWNSELIHRRSPRTADVPRQSAVMLLDLPRSAPCHHKDGLGFLPY